MARLIDLTGKRFGHLMAYFFAGKINKTNHHYWGCICDCGEHRVISGANLRSGNSLSCGCLQKKRTSAANKKHGMSMVNRSEYRSWNAMRGRCNNPNNQDYPDYGGRGVVVCNRWDDFSAFLNDLGECPSGYSLDRIDVNGNYEPKNCRWVDSKTQARNKRSTRWIDVNGQVKCLAEWAEISGTSYKTIQKRIMRGWTNAEAIFGRAK